MRKSVIVNHVLKRTRNGDIHENSRKAVLDKAVIATGIPMKDVRSRSITWDWPVFGEHHVILDTLADRI